MNEITTLERPAPAKKDVRLRSRPILELLLWVPQVYTRAQYILDFYICFGAASASTSSLNFLFSRSKMCLVGLFLISCFSINFESFSTHFVWNFSRVWTISQCCVRLYYSYNRVNKILKIFSKKSDYCVRMKSRSDVETIFYDCIGRTRKH